jgi:hypothetical protein
MQRVFHYVPETSHNVGAFCEIAGLVTPNPLIGGRGPGPPHFATLHATTPVLRCAAHLVHSGGRPHPPPPSRRFTPLRPHPCHTSLFAARAGDARAAAERGLWPPLTPPSARAQANGSPTCSMKPQRPHPDNALGTGASRTPSAPPRTPHRRGANRWVLRIAL